MNTQLRIDSLTVSNFRCFESLTIDFHPNLTVLVARNGQGKTAILDAVKVSLGTFTRAFPHSVSATFSKYDARITEQGILPEPTYPVSVDATGYIDNEVCSWSREKTKPDGVTSIGKTKSLIAYGERLYNHFLLMQQSDLPFEDLSQKKEDIDLPVLAYYSIYRLWTDEKIKDKEGKKYSPLTESRFYAYEYAFFKHQNYGNLKQWLKTALLFTRYSKTAQIESRGVAITNQLEAVTSALSSVLEKEGVYDIEFDYSTFDLCALIEKHNKNNSQKDIADSLALPVSKLSDGVRGMFAMVADIAWRCAKLNPHFGKDACKKTYGIVLIDEVDLCLHPAWQQRIIGDLQRTFPNIQFIVTTHSPQVVSSVPRECVRIIEDGEVLPADIQTQGVESQDILARIFGTSPAPKNDPYVQKLQEYAKMEAAGQADSEKGKVLYQELAQHFGEQYPPLQMIEIHRKFIAKRSKSDA